MKKTLVYLMNGFGIEQKDSHNIYNSNLMPNLERMTKQYLFGTIESKSLDLYGAYREFSTSSKLSLTYPFLDQYTQNLDLNPNVTSLIDRIPETFTLQLFVFLRNSKTFEHLRNFSEYLTKKNKHNINLHIILDSKNINDYKEYETLITKINYSLKELPIKTIVGKQILKENPKSYVQILNKGVGEKWKELEKKFTTLSNGKITPEDADAFYYVDKFEFDEKSCVLFFNYEMFDCTNFVESLKMYNKITNYYSVFPLTGIDYPLYAYPTSTICMENNLEKLKFKSLMLAPENSISRINYFLNGLKSDNCKNVAIASIQQEHLTNNEYYNKLTDAEEFDLFIVNDDISESKTIDELRDNLKRIDQTLEILEKLCEEKKITLIISSLFGIKKEIKQDHLASFMINFSEKVPFIIKDEQFTKNNYQITFGDLSNLADTIYTNVNNEHVGKVLIKKKSFLSSILKK